MGGGRLAGLALTVLVSLPAAALAQETKVAIGISGWTGFAPLTLAKEAGIYKKNGLDVTIKKIPQSSRHLAIASGDIQCAATTTETYLVWNAAGVPIKELFQLDKSYGADGLVVRPGINSVADLKGKTIAADVPGTSEYFGVAWILNKNGLSMKDVKIVNLSAGPAAQAFLAGQNDAAWTYEPYLSNVRAKPDVGKILATTLDYPMVTDTFGCSPSFIDANPKAVKALADSYFEALDMIAKDPRKSNEIMGADVKQTGEEFAASAKYLKWVDREGSRKFFAGEFDDFNKAAAKLLLEAGVLKTMPDLNLADTRFLQ
ncbi:MAG: ABC transporter substrate-binding protein [Methylobacteriaceae bacterium]|nr:ABC transporter substrate-binding protein [Methylobacteriaceae bacterium]MBV9245222.1 ABC transporter substrate-binding protein [Methylobacteriaceae bacterium]